MIRCAHCQSVIEATEEGPPPLCPNCGLDPAPNDGESDWVSIARFTGIAEVGYFADRLEMEKIDCRVEDRDDFDAISGHWDKTFVLRVPTPQSERALRAVRAELADSPDANEVVNRIPAVDDESRTVWMPVMLMLMAGGLLYLAGRARGPAAAVERPNRDAPTLWRALSEGDEVFRSGHERDERTLRYDKRRGVFWLEEDTDGDGRIDRRRAYRNGLLIEDQRREN